MDELRRVFFHELGHFVAHQLNAKFYNGHETKSITLEPFPPMPELYIGEAKIAYENGGNNKYAPSREELPNYLAGSTYGCLFQAYLTGEGLKEAQNKNGSDDLQKWYGALSIYQLQDYNADIHDIDLAFMNELRNQKLLEDFLALNPDDYLHAQDGGVFFVDVQKLRNETSGLIEKHKPIFDGLINKYITVLPQTA